MQRAQPRALALLLMAAWLALPAAGRAAALVETFDADKPAAQVLGGLAGIGVEGAWSTTLEGGAYVWRNDSDAKAVKYIHLDRLPGGVGLAEAAVEVDVTVAAAGEPAGAGLIYRFAPASRTYLLYLLMGDGEYGLFYRGADGFRRLAVGAAPGVVPEGKNRLAVRPMADRIEFLVNGNRAVSIGKGQVPGEGVGIAALGKGTFTFDNLSVDPAG